MLRSTLGWISLLVFVSGFSRAPSAQGNVLVVGPGGFSQIGEAVQAAQDGDTILVRAGANHQLLPIFVSKALTIAFDSSTGFAPSATFLDVSNLPAGKTVVASGLSVGHILLKNNAGSVRLVRCRSTTGGYRYWEPAMTIESSSGSTALASCIVTGGTPTYSGPGSAGLAVEDALAAVFDSTLTGGRSADADKGAYPGGTGASVVRNILPARLLLANSSVKGGRGGDLDSCLYYSVSAPGGDGLVVGTGATATRLASTIAGGAAGTAAPCGTIGAPGAALVISGTLSSLTTSALKLTTPTVAREGQTITLTITGVPGDRVNLVAGLQTAFRELMDGVLLVRPGPSSLSPLRGHLGTIGPSGIFTVSYTLPLLPAGTGALNLWFQALARHTDGRRTLGSFSVVTVLDSIY